MNQNQLIQQILKAPNKEEMLNKLIMQNPQLKEFWDMYNKGDYTSLESLVRDKFKQNGRDFDKEFNQFISMFK